MQALPHKHRHPPPPDVSDECFLRQLRATIWAIGAHWATQHSSCRKEHATALSLANRRRTMVENVPQTTFFLSIYLKLFETVISSPESRAKDNRSCENIPKLKCWEISPSIHPPLYQVCLSIYLHVRLLSNFTAVALLPLGGQLTCRQL